MESLILIGFWFAFALQQGWNDARHFAHGAAHYMKTNQPYNIHPSLLTGRSILFLLIMVVSVIDSTSFLTLALAIGLVLTFPFLHEGMYYSSRKIIDDPQEYPNTHFELWLNYSSATSTAKINFPGLSSIIIPKPIKTKGFINFINRNILYYISLLFRFIFSRPVAFIVGDFFCLIRLTG